MRQMLIIVNVKISEENKIIEMSTVNKRVRKKSLCHTNNRIDSSINTVTSSHAPTDIWDDIGQANKKASPNTRSRSSVELSSSQPEFQGEPLHILRFYYIPP